jgi:hypothetical protein
MQQDPFQPAFFLFISKRFDAIKLLTWGIHGYGLYHKVIAGRERFH